MRVTTIIFTLLILLACDGGKGKSDTKNDRLELVSEPDRDLREQYEKQQKDSLVKDSTELFGEELK
ncbi:hypothetical protein [Fulvivirga ligni]|uniref:hypothetical protein n=1 Tax=Fulvivirga ligni TaxID=2904246 RepID=UPI001F2A2C08|nr:hypothetical protein [Fulvivirga ligni]UII22321.1 hypothetical protein LVD16_03640 [Fulvivirga ligni]